MREPILTSVSALANSARRDKRAFFLFLPPTPTSRHQGSAARADDAKHA
jgi:hypothetical protein